MEIANFVMQSMRGRSLPVKPATLVFPHFFLVSFGKMVKMRVAE
jgi:hypothetical protein